jgi:hypothetical protein
MNQKKILYSKRILFLLLIGIIYVPFLVEKLNFINEKKLGGWVPPSPNVDFNWTDWFNRPYQVKKEAYLNDNFGLRNTLVRSYNQLLFSAFKKPTMQGIFVGKHGFLFDSLYTKCYYGYDFIGEKNADSLFYKIKYLQDTLAKLNKTLFVVFCPNKSAVLNEYLPESMRLKKTLSNYDYMTKLAQEKNINLIDFHKWFLSQKRKAIYPLYPKYGIHWSSYYENLVADSIIHYIEGKRMIDLPDLHFSPPEWCDTCRENDCDLLDGMNLFVNPGNYRMPYSNIGVTEKKGQTKCSFLAISDSYWYNIIAKQIPGKVFNNANFWFYFRDNISGMNEYISGVEKLNVKDEIMNRDVIMLMGTETNYGTIGYGFVQQAYKIFGGK